MTVSIKVLVVEPPGEYLTVTVYAPGEVWRVEHSSDFYTRGNIRVAGSLKLVESKQ